MSSVDVLRDLALIGGVTNAEFDACDLRALLRRDAWIFGQLLISGHVANITGAIDAVGVEGGDTLRHWIQEASLGGWGVTSPGDSHGSLPSCCRCELRKVIESSLGSLLDGPCSVRLARLGYIRFSIWSTAELERELDDDHGLSKGLQDRVAGWFLSGLAHQTEVLLQGLGRLATLAVALEYVQEPLELGAVVKELLQTTAVAHGCLRAAATLVKHGIPAMDPTDRLMSLLSLRVLDWTFRRIEFERPAVSLRLDWRMHSSRLFWEFLSGGGTRAGAPVAVVQAFTIGTILTACRAKESRANATQSASATSQAEPAVSSDTLKDTVDDSLEQLGHVPLEDENGKKESQRRKRQTRKKTKDSAVKGCEASSEDAAAGLLAMEEALDNSPEPSQAMREWNRLSVRMMLDMGWRAEDGNVR
eukprot:TRINITY_DN45421_c0_g1_i1.p1 TRINITY_DN45421_c0_g1~~TRINITY_DN45421_c0_g1_i1.p1  ORF type:complete len:418 (+),score=53.38 TRINITY_DN45421_c0_g1_i1:95-1348(+)